MKSKVTLLMILFTLSLLAAPFAVSAEPRHSFKEDVLETILAEVKRELGGVPLAGFSVTKEELDLDVKDDSLSYSGEFKRAGVMDEAALEQAKRHFASVVDRAYGLESYEIELEDDSLDVSFEQSRDIITVGGGVYAVLEYIPYVSVSVSLTGEEADEDDDDKDAGKSGKTYGTGYTTLEYDIDITLERRVVRLQLGQKNARVNGEARRLEAAPLVEGGRTLVPLRFLGEQLGAVFLWDEDDKEVTFTRGAVTIKIRLGDDEARIHVKGAPSRTVALEVPVKVVQDRTVVPLRFVSENLGAVVRWNPSDRSIIVRQ
jgi:HSP20 family molecular chaperone IbpA